MRHGDNRCCEQGISSCHSVYPKVLLMGCLRSKRLLKNCGRIRSSQFYTPAAIQFMKIATAPVKSKVNRAGTVLNSPTYSTYWYWYTFILKQFYTWHGIVNTDKPNFKLNSGKRKKVNLKSNSKVRLCFIYLTNRRIFIHSNQVIPKNDISIKLFEDKSKFSISQP